MNIRHEEEIREEALMETARKMMVAARTAPKARGKDNIVMALLTREGIRQVSEKIREMAAEKNLPAFFLRDAENILSAGAMIAIGTRIEPLGLHPCGMCGFADCDEKRKHPDHPCSLNAGDLGIAMGSAVSVAADNRVDNRIMYTAGQAIMKMKILGEDVKIAYGIPLSISGKNPFFDRKNP